MESLKRIDPPKAIVTDDMIIVYTEMVHNSFGHSWVPYINTSECNDFILVKFVANINVLTRMGYFALHRNRQWKN